MRQPAIRNVLDVVKGAGELRTVGLDRRWVPARTAGFHSIVNRWKAAWLVFTGMGTELGNLLDCSFSSTTLGQQSLVSAFTASSNTQIDSLAAIVTRLDTPNTLNTDAINKSIMTNPDLTAADIAKVDDILAKIGSSTTSALSVSSVSSSSYPVYDVSLLQDVQPSLASAALGDSTLTDFISSKVMSMDLSGQLTYA